MGLLDDIDEGRVDANSKVLRKLVPGYDYRTREERSDTDQALREKLQRELEKVSMVLDDIGDAVYDDGAETLNEDVSALKKKVQVVRDELESGASGGGLLAGLSDASDEDLVNLIEFDARLINSAEYLNSVVDEFRTSIKERAQEGLDADVQDRIEDLVHDVDIKIAEIRKQMKNRKDYLKGL